MQTMSSLVTCLVVAVCISGCSSDDKKATGNDQGPKDAMADSSEPDDHRLPESDTLPSDAVPEGDTVHPPPACECAVDKICDQKGKCIDIPVPAAGEYFSEMALLRQHRSLGDPSSIIDNLGKGEAHVYAHEPLPADTRTTYATVEGESCWMEYGTIWPWSPAEGKWWPEGPGLDAGHLAFAVDGAAGPIILEADDSGYPDWPGWGYVHVDVPPPANPTFPDFFDPETYLPHGASFVVSNAGGAHVATQTFNGGAMPNDFRITAPSETTDGHTHQLGQPLKITWDPPQPGAIMDLFLTQDQGMGAVILVSCQLDDDGEVNIPSTVLTESFMVQPIGIQLRRNVRRYQRAEAADGKVLHVTLVGRHARFSGVALQAQ